MRAVVLIITVNILSSASCYPTEEFDPDSCLPMTPERQKQIDDITAQLTEFVNSLYSQYEDIDVTSLRLNIEKHVDSERDKETVITVSINDCIDTQNMGFKNPEIDTSGAKEADFNEEIDKTDISDDAPGDESAVKNIADIIKFGNDTAFLENADSLIKLVEFNTPKESDGHVKSLTVVVLVNDGKNQGPCYFSNENPSTPEASGGLEVIVKELDERDTESLAEKMKNYTPQITFEQFFSGLQKINFF